MWYDENSMIQERGGQMDFIFVALGGAVGAVGRYAVSLLPVKGSFPVLTLVTNVVGAVLIGLVVGLSSGREDTSRRALLFWKAGVCGGFTTFSTFSLEAFSLFEQKHYGLGGAYLLLSCGLCLLGVFCGTRLAALLRA